MGSRLRETICLVIKKESLSQKLGERWCVLIACPHLLQISPVLEYLPTQILQNQIVLRLQKLDPLGKHAVLYAFDLIFRYGLLV